MVKGLDTFKEYFQNFSEQYVLIGGAACDLSFHDSSLSAILLNEEYYRLLMKGREMVDGISILSASCLIPFKAKAWLDLRERQNAGKHVDSRDIKKHRNDVLRIAAELPLEEIELSAAIKEEMSVFIAAVRKDNPDIKTLGLKNIKLEDILKLLEEIYCKK